MDVGLAKTGHEIGLGESPTPTAPVKSGYYLLFKGLSKL
jgi:hypothetical protein